MLVTVTARLGQKRHPFLTPPLPCGPTRQAQLAPRPAGDDDGATRHPPAPARGAGAPPSPGTPAITSALPAGGHRGFSRSTSRSAPARRTAHAAATSPRIPPVRPPASGSRRPVAVAVAPIALVGVRATSRRPGRAPSRQRSDSDPRTFARAPCCCMAAVGRENKISSKWMDVPTAAVADY